MSSEHILQNSSVSFSKDIQGIVDRVGSLELAPEVPQTLQHLNIYLQNRIIDSVDKLKAKGQKIEVFGADWSRDNPQIAGKSHADIIVATYGSTYALPNKYPEQNVKALNEGNMDMYLIFENGKPVGTACMVIEKSGWAELGRAASLGSVGNELIQNLRILKWLTDKDMSKKVFGLFSTCRSAPDRNIGTEDKPEMMRGGQAVTHIWSRMPGAMIGGFGPLYKKHGALEQFAYTFITNKDTFALDKNWILKNKDNEFVDNWLNYYSISRLNLSTRNDSKLEPGYTVHYPPLESGLTDLIHGEITMGKNGESFDDLDKSLSRLEEVKVPFIQVQVPVDKNTLELQKSLIDRGFQAFLFSPGVVDKQSPLLWFGRLTPGIKVVPTFWDNNNQKNPFWNNELASFASKAALDWNKNKRG